MPACDNPSQALRGVGGYLGALFPHPKAST
jgi:hypothetical protein